MGGMNHRTVEVILKPNVLEVTRLGKKRKVMYIQDTTLDNYWDIPLKIMQGYMTILVEAWNVGNLDDPANIPAHVFLQVSDFKKNLEIILAENRGCP